MITTDQTVTQTLSLDSQQFNLPRKQQFVARWRKVEEKLICQWVLA